MNAHRLVCLFWLSQGCSPVGAPKSAAPSTTTESGTLDSPTEETGDTDVPPDSADTGDDIVHEEPVCDPLLLTQVRTWDETMTPRITGWGAAVGDFDGDGVDDVIIASRGASRLLLGGSTGLAPTDRARVDGGPLLPGSSAAATDIDNDGDIDIFLGTEPGTPDVLLYNEGDLSFRAVPLPDSSGFSGTGLFADLDGNGRLDLFVGRRLAAGATIEDILNERLPGDPSSLYLQSEAGVFTDASDRLPAFISDAHTQAAGVFDVDRDGDLDIFLANDFGPWIVPDTLLLNDGSANFASDDTCFCDLSHYGMSAAIADFNRDLSPDIYITDIGGPDLLAGFGDGTFYDATLAWGAALPAAEDQLVAWGTIPMDLDRNGWLDLPVAFGVIAEVQQDSVDLLDPTWTWSDDQRDALLMGGPDGFANQAPALGFDDPNDHRGMVRGDFDGDGRDELFVTGMRHSAYWDIAGGCPSELRLTLVGLPGNLDAIGAEVDVEVDGGLQRLWVMPTGTGSSSTPVLSVGLGHHTSVDRLTVRWPNGEEGVWTDVPAGPLTLRQ